MESRLKATVLAAGLVFFTSSGALANPEWCASVGDFVERAAVARQFQTEPAANLLAFIEQIEVAAIERGENRENVGLLGDALRLIVREIFSSPVGASREARDAVVRTTRRNYEVGCRQGAAE
jgi:hypothetical protein